MAGKLNFAVDLSCAKSCARLRAYALGEAKNWEKGRAQLAQRDAKPLEVWAWSHPLVRGLVVYDRWGAGKCGRRYGLLHYSGMVLCSVIEPVDPADLWAMQAVAFWLSERLDWSKPVKQLVENPRTRPLVDRAEDLGWMLRAGAEAVAS